MTAFWLAFTCTLALFVGAVWTGLRRSRRWHYVIAPLAIGMLTVTIVLTEQLLRAVVFPEAEMVIHLTFAKTAAALVLPIVVTGLLTVKRPKWRRVHLGCVVAFFVFVLIATGTGLWVFSLSTPR